MTLDKLLELFTGLQIYTANSQRAPHKPLLVLWAIGRCLKGHPRLVSYKEVDKALTNLLEEFGPRRQAIHTEFPFWRLQKDGVWEIPNATAVEVGPGGDARKNSLHGVNAHGGFTEEIQAAFQNNTKHARQVAGAVANACFPPSLCHDVLQAVGIDSDIFRSDREFRDPTFSPTVLEAYRYRCAICEFSVFVGDDPIALDATHIKWPQYNGPDETQNGLALCALHHRLFNKGIFTVSIDLTIRVVPADLARGPGFKASLGGFDSKSILLPNHANDFPDPRFLQWHEKEVFRYH